MNGELLAVAREAAVAAGALLVERFRTSASGVAAKSTRTDLVSDADRDAEQRIVRLLRERRPDDGIVAEEGAFAESRSGLRWVIDPLDGTINFLFGVAQWCVSVACVDGDGSLVGVVHDPLRGETFAAARGAGATLGSEPLRVSEQPDLALALVATGFGYDAEIRRLQADVLVHILPKVRDVRRFGSAALDLAWVAAGRLDAYFETGVNEWDRAAGGLLVREAGGTVALVDGIGADRRIGVVASNGRVHAALLGLLGLASSPR